MVAAVTRPLPDGPLLGDTADDDWPTDLADATRTELADLWSDLSTARQFAIGGVWSMQCDNLAYRIVCLSRLVGPTPWGDVGVDVLLDGLYERLHVEAGIAYPPIDWKLVRSVQAEIERSAKR